MRQTDSMSISRALADEQWDYISLQQVSGAFWLHEREMRVSLF